MSTTNDDTENLIPPEEPQTLPFWARAVAWSTGMLGAVILAFAGITSLVVNILSVRGKGFEKFEIFYLLQSTFGRFPLLK